MYNEWTELANKRIKDGDGFYTDYVLYTDGYHYICMFGDRDLYTPDPDYADFETTSESEAWEWFNSFDDVYDPDGESDYDVYAADDTSSSEPTNDIEFPYQEYDSAATSINSNKLPAIYKMVNFEPGKVYLDLGGGKFDNGVYFVKDKGATLLVYDPYNRSDEHNKQVLAELKENGGADAGLNSNVLNVIKEPEARLAVLRNLRRLVKPGGDIYITVYEGTGKGDEGPTKAGYQLNRKTADYLEEIQQVFPNATRKGKLIKATNASSSVYGKQVYCTSLFASDTDIDAEDLRGLSREQIEQILDEAPVGAEVVHIRNLKNRFNMDVHIEKKSAYQANYYQGMGTPLDFKDEDTFWEVGAYKDPYIDDTIYKAVNGIDGYYGLTSEVLKAHGITSASYGGAYDILDDYYFTRDDLVDFGEEVVAQLENLEPGDYFVNDLDMLDPKTIHIEVYCRDKEAYADKNIAIDMRRIQKPSDLNKYAYQVALDMYDEFSEHDEVNSSSDYQIMKKSYKNYRKFRSQGDAEYLDFIDELDHKGVAHDQYDNLKDDGCTVFYDDPKTPVVSNGTDAVTSADGIGYSSFQDPRLQPPEYDDPEELEYNEEIVLSLDEIVDVDDEGNWEYEDKAYSFAANPNSRDRDWYTEENHIFVTDHIGVVEDVDSVLERNMPVKPGRYRISGEAHMFYDVYGVYEYRYYYGPDAWDSDIDSSNAETDFNFAKSYIDDLQIVELDQ